MTKPIKDITGRIIKRFLQDASWNNYTVCDIIDKINKELFRNGYSIKLDMNFPKQENFEYPVFLALFGGNEIYNVIKTELPQKNITIIPEFVDKYSIIRFFTNSNLIAYLVNPLGEKYPNIDAYNISNQFFLFQTSVNTNNLRKIMKTLGKIDLSKANLKKDIKLNNNLDMEYIISQIKRGISAYKLYLSASALLYNAINTLNSWNNKYIDILLEKFNKRTLAETDIKISPAINTYIYYKDTIYVTYNLKINIYTKNIILLSLLEKNLQTTLKKGLENFIDELKLSFYTKRLIKHYVNITFVKLSRNRWEISINLRYGEIKSRFQSSPAKFKQKVYFNEQEFQRTIYYIADYLDKKYFKAISFENVDNESDKQLDI